MNAKLVIFNRKGHKKEISLKSGTSTIGRRPDCDVRIPLSIVSRKHCRFTINEQELTIQDLGSANGTYVNSAMVTEAKIKAGDIVKVGPMKFVVQIDGHPKEIFPPPDDDSMDDSFESSIPDLAGSSISLDTDDDFPE